jgi:hypothetical protein
MGASICPENVCIDRVLMVGEKAAEITGFINKHSMLRGLTRRSNLAFIV